MRITKKVIEDKILNQFGWLTHDKDIKWEIKYDKNFRAYYIHCERAKKVINFTLRLDLTKNDVVEFSWFSGSITGIMFEDINSLVRSLVHYSYMRKEEKK